MIRALLLAFVATAAAANAPMSKLAGSRVAAPKALPKALELRGGGKPSAELSIKLTQAAAAFYSLQCLFVPDMVRRRPSPRGMVSAPLPSPPALHAAASPCRWSRSTSTSSRRH